MGQVCCKEILKTINDIKSHNNRKPGPDRGYGSNGQVFSNPLMSNRNFFSSPQQEEIYDSLGMEGGYAPGRHVIIP